ncbi:MAG: ATP-dependent 6-phosphofructokinase [Dehalococcoidales bacterium]|nr:ATP-dependent 6-phosphofructokinase [Dehalococcoidales bacterium]
MEEKRPRIGILTGGGDCPGLNAAIRACAKTAIRSGYEVIGIHNGWQGLLEHDDEVLDLMRTSGIIDKGGTILGTSRVSPLRVENGVQKVRDRFNVLRLEGIVVVGGEGSLSLSYELCKRGIPVVGIPKTIDNDVKETDFSIGFQTAVQIASDALDRLRSTAESHHRVMLLEVMGRNTGWIATYAGLANGADEILIPEIPLTEEKLDDLCERLKRRRNRGIKFSIMVVAEGIKILGKSVLQEEHDNNAQSNAPRLGGVAQVLGNIIQERTSLETRVSTLGYIQRGGTPVAYDRTLATAFGVKATELVKAKKYGEMTALRGVRVVGVPLEKVANGVKTVNLNAYAVARRFFAN